jgi:hypothetical protein
VHRPLAVKGLYVRSRCWLDGGNAVSSNATGWRAGLAEPSKARQVMSQCLASLLGLRAGLIPATTTSGWCAAKETK